MLRLKEYFTDGLLQVAIVLSLLRTDFDLYFGSQFQRQWRLSELQEIIVGPHVGYMQTDFHSRTSWRDSHFYPKHVDYLGSDDILYDLHSLADYQRFDGLDTGINTWLVNGPEPQLPLSQQSSQVSTSPTSELGHSGPPGVSSVQPQAQSTSVGDTNSRSFSAYFGTELTKEDMDLIDILWRQDIDLGISRDMFDASLRQEQDKEYSNKVNATEEVKTDNDTLRDLIPLSENHTNYAVDNETGELIPVTPTVTTVTDDDVMQLLQEIEQIDNLYQTNDTGLKTEQHEQNNTLDGLFGVYTSFQSTEACNTGNLLSNELETSGLTMNTTGQLEESWQDVLSLLSDQLNMTTQAGNTSVIHQHQQNDLLTDLDLLNISHSSSSSSDNITRNSVLFNRDTVQHRSLDQLQQQQPQQFNSSEMWNPLNFDSSANQSLLVNNVSLADNHIFSTEPLRQLNNSIVSYNRFSTPQLSLQMQPLLNETFDANTTFISTSQQQLSPIFSLSQSSTPTTNITSLLLGFTDNTTNSSLFNGNAVGSLLNTAANNTLPDLSTLNMSQPMTLAPYANNDTFIQQLLQNDLSDLTFDDNFDEDTTALDYEALNENWSTDSAVSSMHSPSEMYAASSYNDDVTSMDGMEELEGATGGSSSKDEIKYADMLTSYSYEYDSQKSLSFDSNTSSSSNSSQPQYLDIVPLKKHIAHNHTYYLQPGQRSREEKEAELRREKEERATRCKDAKRAQMLKIPLNIDDIIDLPVDQFTELLSRYTLSEAQHQLIRDIRRRGKNKAAAQNCRKRKLEVIQSLEDEVEGLRQERDKLRHNQMKLAGDTMMMKEKFARLQADMLRSLRDASGQQYNPDEYTLQRTSDGDIILVPRNTTTLGNNGNSAKKNAASNVRTENNYDESDSRKRKPKKKE